MQVGWHIHGFRYAHETGTYFVNVVGDEGRAVASRVYGTANMVEHIGNAFDGHENVAVAMLACQRRIEELAAERELEQLLPAVQRVA
jgi:hypothetical protein